MEPLEGPPVSSPDPAIISSVEQQASSSTHAVSDMLASSPSVMTHTPQVGSRLTFGCGLETYGYWLTSLMAASYHTALLPAGACPPLIDHTSHLHVGYPTISHPPITALDRRHPI